MPLDNPWNLDVDDGDEDEEMEDYGGRDDLADGEDDDPVEDAKPEATRVTRIFHPHITGM